MSVTANGDITLIDALFGTLDGGDVSVESLNGSVIACSGTNDMVSFTRVSFDPVSGRPMGTSLSFGLLQGIVACTFPKKMSTNHVGNLSIAADKDVYLGWGEAALQFALNGTGCSDSELRIFAGDDIVCEGDTVVIQAAGNAVITVLHRIGGILFPTPISGSFSAAVGAVIQLSAPSGDLTLFTIQWFKSGVLLPGENQPSLSFTPHKRNDSGLYQEVISYGTSSVTNTYEVRVMAPQRLEAPVRQPDGLLRMRFSDPDGFLFTESDIPHFTVQVSSDLVEWEPLDVTLEANPDGTLQFDDTLSEDSPACFYRIMEQ